MKIVVTTTNMLGMSIAPPKVPPLARRNAVVPAKRKTSVTTKTIPTSL